MNKPQGVSDETWKELMDSSILNRLSPDTIFMIEDTDMTIEEFNNLSQEDKSLFTFLDDNIGDMVNGELTQKELVRLFFNNLKYKNTPQ